MSADYHHLRFEGVLDIGRYPEFRAAFAGLAHATPVLVDLTIAESVDSVFLSEMMLARRRHEAPFAILIPPLGLVARVFEIANFDRRPYVFHDLSDALASLAQSPESGPTAG